MKDVLREPNIRLTGRRARFYRQKSQHPNSLSTDWWLDEVPPLTRENDVFISSTMKTMFWSSLLNRDDTRLITLLLSIGDLSPGDVLIQNFAQRKTVDEMREQERCAGLLILPPSSARAPFHSCQVPDRSIEPLTWTIRRESIRANMFMWEQKCNQSQ